MEHKLTQGNTSNYEFVITFNDSELNGFKDKVMKSFQKDINLPGFRKGFVPLHLVEQQVNPEYLKMGIYEEAIHNGLTKVMTENPEIKFIGNIYDLHQDQKDGNVVFTFKLDVYPEVEETNQNWKTLSIDKLDEEVTQEEIDATFENIRRQYANYEDADAITENSVFKAKYNVTDKKDESLQSGTLYLGKEEFEEFPGLKEVFIGKGKETVETKYDEKNLPKVVHPKQEDAKPAKVSFEIVEIKEVVLPELTTETIKTLFGDEIKDFEDLSSRVVETIKDQKKQMGLLSIIDAYIEKAKDSLKVTVPQTIVAEEYKGRLDNFKQRVGGEEGFKKYIQSVGEEQGNKIFEELKTTAGTSIEKFFLFRKITALLGIENEIDWNKNLDAEQKLYEKLSSEGKVQTSETTEKKEKAPKKSKKTE